MSFQESINDRRLINSFWKKCACDSIAPKGHYNWKLLLIACTVERQRQELAVRGHPQWEVLFQLLTDLSICRICGRKGKGWLCRSRSWSCRSTTWWWWTLPLRWAWWPFVQEHLALWTCDAKLLAWRTCHRCQCLQNKITLLQIYSLFTRL